MSAADTTDILSYLCHFLNDISYFPETELTTYYLSMFNITGKWE